jgi:hypothetical protein
MPRVGAHQDGHRDAERRDLRERQIYEDDAALDDVQSQVDEQAGQKDQREERPEQSVKIAMGSSTFPRRERAAIALTLLSMMAR